jgi:N-acetylglutamate synthase-like GNAT family acetyltransferase
MLKKQLPNWEIRHELEPGDLGYLIYLHGALYAKEFKYDKTFEAYVAHGLIEFVKSFNPYRDRIWLAEAGGRIIGSVAIVRSTKLEAQLRWYLVHPDYRGHGLGKTLIQEALNFCKDRKYNSVFLWTTSELTTAAHLYTETGFKKKEVKSHNVWGKFLAEEKYELQII